MIQRYIVWPTSSTPRPAVASLWRGPACILSRLELGRDAGLAESGFRPTGLGSTAFKLDIPAALNLKGGVGLSLIEIVFVFLFVDMFDNVVKAVSENGIEVPREHKFHAEFKGFDERCDGKFTEYAKFLVRKQRRFQRFKDLDFISDSPVSIVKYRKMLDVFHTLPITEQINLSASNLAKVLAA